MKIRVYYADTDAGGVAYHASYLRWMEMARWELMADRGLSIADYARQGIILTVVRIQVDYRRPAMLGDQLRLETAVQTVRRVRFVLHQRTVRAADGQELADGQVTVACVDPQGRVQALPHPLVAALRSCAA